jgi:mannose-6-phosphate isomerase-like protein (cupin superfamily)
MGLIMDEPAHLLINPKAWGHNIPISSNESFEVHYASIDSFGFSSRHYHSNKYNQMFVMYGKIFLEIYACEQDAIDGKEIKVIELRPGMSFTVPPRVWHRFRAGDEFVDLIEVYWAEPVDKDDIRRVDVGGKGSPDIESF